MAKEGTETTMSRIMRGGVCLILGGLVLSAKLSTRASRPDETPKPLPLPTTTYIWKLPVKPLPITNLYEDGKYLIINCDDFGLCPATNMAVIKAYNEGIATSATMMMPTPGIDEAIAYLKSHPKFEVGVHLCVNNEYEKYHWATVLSPKEVPSLLGPDGWQWRDAKLFSKHARGEEIEKEFRAQIQKALNAGIRITHLDHHMMSHYHMLGLLRSEHLECMLKLGKEYDLPIRRPWDAKGKKLAESMGILCSQRLISWDGRLPLEKKLRIFSKSLGTLQPGINELFLHPSYADDLVRDIMDEENAFGRESDLRFLLSPEAKEIIEESDVQLIGYGAVLNAQRKLKEE